MSDQLLYEKPPSYMIRRRLFRNKPAMFGFYIIIFAQVVAALGYLIMPDDTPNAEGGSSIYMKKMPLRSRDVMLLKESKNEEIEKVNIFARMFLGQESEFQKIYPVKDYEIKDDTLSFSLLRTDMTPHEDTKRQPKKFKDGSQPIVSKRDSLMEKFENGSMFNSNTKHKLRKVLLLDFVKPLYVNAGNESAVYTFKEMLKTHPYFKEDTILYSGVIKLQNSNQAYTFKDTSFYSHISDRYYYRSDTIVYMDFEKQLRFTTVADLQKEFETKNVEVKTFYLGTDQSGRDILSRIILGTRISLAIGFVSVLISLIVGVTLGAIAGYYQGMIDNVVMWIMTVIWSIPSIMLVIAISLVLGSKGIWVVFVAIGLTIWVDIARIVRGEVMSIKQKLYVESAKAFGISNFMIIYKHILPNLLGSIIVILFANFASAILMEAGLSFLGIGVQLPVPSWGNMLKEGWAETNNSVLITIPSLCIIVLVLSFNLFGNGLRDAYDPKNSSN